MEPTSGFDDVTSQRCQKESVMLQPWWTVAPAAERRIRKAACLNRLVMIVRARGSSISPVGQLSSLCQ